MTDPTRPDQQMPELAGITEYDAYIPFYRSTDRGPEEMHIVVRIPAADPEGAFKLAMQIAEHLGKNHTDPDGHVWSEVIPDITVTDAAGTPAPAELAAELAHWRRVVAALAAKAPGLLMVTPQEYLAADPEAIVSTRAGDAMVFLPPAALAEPPAPEPVTPARTTPGTDPVIEPVGDDQLPVTYGHHADPDVRRVAAHTLARAKPEQIELIGQYQEWVRLDTATINHEQGTVTVVIAGQDYHVPADRMLIARPATVEGFGTDLPAAHTQRRQVLTGTGWMNVQEVDYAGSTSDSYRVLLSDGETHRTTSIAASEAVLLRQGRPGWWA
jgi:hypothetical protein